METKTQSQKIIRVLKFGLLGLVGVASVIGSALSGAVASAATVADAAPAPNQSKQFLIGFCFVLAITLGSLGLIAYTISKRVVKDF